MLINHISFLQVLYREGISQPCPEGTNWISIDSEDLNLVQISTGPSGLLWGVQWDGAVVVRTGISYQNPLGLYCKIFSTTISVIEILFHVEIRKYNFITSMACMTPMLLVTKMIFLKLAAHGENFAEQNATNGTLLSKILIVCAQNLLRNKSFVSLRKISIVFDVFCHSWQIPHRVRRP